jgi:hypothetical protein
MVTKKSSDLKNKATKTRDSALQTNAVQADEIMYAMANTSVILMSLMMGAFSQIAVTMTGAMASGMAEAMGGKEAGEEVTQEFKQKSPEVDDKIKATISDIRKDIYAQMKQKSQGLQQFLSNPTFEEGPKIINKYIFNLPKLTEELDNNALAKYSQLLIKEDEQFAKMFKELTEWLSSLPKDPNSDQKSNGN